MQSGKRLHWIGAMGAEIQSLIDQRVYNLVDRPPGVKVPFSFYPVWAVDETIIHESNAPQALSKSKRLLSQSSIGDSIYSWGLVGVAEKIARWISRLVSGLNSGSRCWNTGIGIEFCSWDDGLLVRVVGYLFNTSEYTRKVGAIQTLLGIRTMQSRSTVQLYCRLNARWDWVSLWWLVYHFCH